MCLGHKISYPANVDGISQRQLADVVGISRSYLSKLECGYGISGVSIEVVSKLLIASIFLPVNCYIFVCKTINPVIDIFSKHYERVEFFRRAHQRFLELKKRL